MSSRNGGFTHDEDILLCTKWLNISQDPKVGRYQTMKEFWSRVANAYNEAAEEQQIEQRTVRSLQTRMDRITAEVKKMLGCIRQIENMNPSGASNDDILIRANMLFKQEVKNSKGFRFEHVRSIVADFVKCQDNVPTARQIARQQISLNMSNSSHSENPNPESPAAVSPGISSFSINLDDENVEATSSQRPIGIKKKPN